jgi:hypothetical protein
MGLGLVARGRARRASALLQPWAACAASILVLAAGCGTRSSDTKPKGPTPAAVSGTAHAGRTTVAAARPAHGTVRPVKGDAAPAHEATVPSGRSNVVLLTEKGCVQLEPHWRTLEVGQALQWRSTLKTTVTLHVSGGAFDKTVYVIRPGAMVTSGPARGAGSYSIWTDPPSCQGVPRGVQGSGPGLTIKGPNER